MKLEIRAKNDATVSGYVNAVERDSKVLPSTMCPKAKKSFVEKIKVGTFKKAIQKADNIELRFNHGKVIGDTKSGDLELREDSIGLYAKAKITDEDVITKAEKEGLKGWSFGFTSNSDEWSDRSDDLQCRSIDDISLREVSILTIAPAYAGTSIEMRGENCEATETRG